MAIETFDVAFKIPTDDNFIGRTCTGKGCRKYFKVKLDSLLDTMHCPYCGDTFSKEDLLTPEQKKLMQQVAIETLREHVFGMLDTQFSQLEKEMRGSKHVSFKHHPIRYRAKEVEPTYEEKSVDSNISCSMCSFNFQVYGIFGYCPGCGDDNLHLYDANFAIIKQEISTSSNPERQLRHAYIDLVSVFESVTSHKAKVLSTNSTNFQSLSGTKKFFRKLTGANIFDGIEEKKIRDLRRVFQKRHVYIHNKGIINDAYIKFVPEDAKLKGQKATLSMAELEGAMLTMKEILHAVLSTN